MTKWQRRARLLIAVFAVAFGVVLLMSFKARAPVQTAGSSVRTDPNALVESTTGRVMRFKRTREDVTVDYEKQLTYKDGSTRLIGVKISTEERGGSRTFSVTSREGAVAQNESSIDLTGNVTLVASDGLTARTEHATYSAGDGLVRASGPVEFSRNRLSGSGVGMTYDKNLDVLVILDQAKVAVVPDADGRGGMDIAAAGATVARRDRYMRFDRGIRALHAGQRVEADSALAHLAEGGERLERIELRGNSKITGDNAAAGALQGLTGRDMDLTYASDGQTLEHAVIMGDAVLTLAGQKNSPGRQIAATTLDVALAGDGTTPTALTGRDAVRLTYPAEQGGATRTIKAASLDARGAEKKGLTNATLTGEVDFRETGSMVNRVAKAGVLELALDPGTGSIEQADFAHNARFATENGLSALSAAARYRLAKGTLELTGTEPGAPRPHTTTDRISIEATRIDVALEGPRVKAAGDVRSVLKPAKNEPAAASDHRSDTKMPSMLKSDQPVNVIADELDYDGEATKAVYNGKAKLWQVDTSVQAQTITIDSRTGDLLASGSVGTTTMLQQGEKGQKKERVRSIGAAKQFTYEESLRRATYTGDAHLSGPQGDMLAAKIELYLQPSGDELDRAEAYDNLTLREQNRKTTGTRLTYTTADDTYVVTGAPVTILDECGRETVGQRLTFVKSTDTINIDGNGARTQTKGGKCP